MSKIVRLENPTELSGPIVLSPTDTCFKGMADTGFSFDKSCRLLRDFTRSDIFVARSYKNKYDEDRIDIYYGNLVFTLSKSDRDTDQLTIRYIKPIQLIDNNYSLKDGVAIRPTKIIVTIRNRTENVFVYYESGKVYPLDGYDIVPAGKGEELFEKLILAKGKNNANRNKPKTKSEEYALPEEAKRILNLAETYNYYEYDARVSETESRAPLSYWDPEPVLYNRQEKISYKVHTAPLDEEKYKVNTRLRFKVDGDKVMAATVTEISPGISDDGESDTTLTLLFEDEFSFDSFPSSGNLYLDPSDIQMKVKKDAIESIRSGKFRRGGTASSSYLPTVLAQQPPAGFKSADLSSLERQLNSEKYPPNESQIKAIKNGIEAKDIYLVQGPPGTGKTTVIVKWVEYFIKTEKKRVLVSSKNNKAVDNVLERLTDIEGIQAIRVGNEAKVQKNLYKYLLPNQIRGLQREMSGTFSGKSRLLDEKTGIYGRYLSNIGSLQSNARKIEKQSRALKLDIKRICDPIVESIHSIENQRAREDLLPRMADIERYVRSIARFTAYLGRNPVLRFIFSPLRWITSRITKRLLSRYEELYNFYITYHIAKRDLYRRAKSICNDPDSISRAENILSVKKELDELKESVRYGPSDEDIFPSRPWPAIKNAKDIETLEKTFAEMKRFIDDRQSQLRKIRSAFNGWKDFINGSNNHALSDYLLESVDLVGRTCIGINSQRAFSDIDFDVVIIDEAGQIQIHDALVPLSRAPKAILLGDHKQIPPIVNEDVKKRCTEEGIETDLLEKSFFEYLYEWFPDKNKIMLDTQYRMPAQIADLLSEWFYEGKYKSFEGKRGMSSFCPRLFRSPFVLVDTSGEKKRFDSPVGKSKKNIFEAEIIVSIVQFLIKEAGNPAEIGIISPYSAQVMEIRKRMKAGVPSLSAGRIQEMVATLDSFQGKEEDVILYSCTRSFDSDSGNERIGFLKELRRLNVALSRPKKQLVFVGDMNFLSGFHRGNGPGSEREFSEFIKLLKRYAQENGEIIPSSELFRREMRQ